MIKYIPQPNESNKCGQAIIAMLLGVTLDKACKIMNKRGKARNSDIIKALKNKDIPHQYSRCRYFEHVPKRAIIKVGYEGQSNTHWVLKYDGLYYDPVLGIVKDFNQDFVLPISYIEIKT